MAARGPWSLGRVRPGTLARLTYVTFLLVAILLAIRWTTGALDQYLPKDWSHAHEYDGLNDWTMARLYLRGKNPYTPESLAEMKINDVGHPPTTAFWFVPLAPLDKAIAAEIIDLTTWFLLVIQLYLCAKQLGFPAPLAVTALAFSWLLTTDGMTMHWHAVQLSEQIALPLAVCWVYLRRGKEVPAGIALGIACTFKLFPGLLILFLLFARRFRAAVTAAAVYLSVAGVMTATYGFSCWPLFLSQQQAITRRWMGSVRNASLQGIILRAISPICEGDVVPRTSATVIATLAGIMILALAAFMCRRALAHARKVDPKSIDVPYALFSVLAVFLNPWIWEHYHVFLILPAFIVLAAFFAPFRRSLRAWLDEEAPGKALVRDGLSLAIVLVGLGAVIRIFSTSVYAKMALEAIWRTHPTPWYHHQLHLMEVLNWLPWAIMVILCLFAAWRLSPDRLLGPTSDGKIP